MTNALAITFVAYFLILAVIGFVAWRRTVTSSDYVLGSRRLSAPVAALSAGTCLACSSASMLPPRRVMGDGVMG